MSRRGRARQPCSRAANPPSPNRYAAIARIRARSSSGPPVAHPLEPTGIRLQRSGVVEISEMYCMYASCTRRRRRPLPGLVLVPISLDGRTESSDLFREHLIDRRPEGTSPLPYSWGRPSATYPADAWVPSVAVEVGDHRQRSRTVLEGSHLAEL